MECDVECETMRESMWRLARRLGGFERECLSCCEVTLAQCHLVGEVGRAERGGLTLNELAARLQLDPSSASRAVDALVKAGYLERVPQEEDRRRVAISLTAAGQGLFRAVNEAGDAMARRLAARIPPGKLAQVTESMALLAAALDEGVDESAAKGDDQSDIDMKEFVRARYAGAARHVLAGAAGASCCAPATAPGCECDLSSVSTDLYTTDMTEGVPAAALQASLGCGNPLLIAALRPGERVLDLGSGGGVDVFLAARRVGPEGFVYGVDMTDEMLELARRNQREACVTNVEFRKGDIENLPLPDGTVDVIISNCVINLASDKRRVLREAFRVLRPAGRLAVSDMVFTRPAPDAIRCDPRLWSCCVAGALLVDDYRDALEAAGFRDITLEVTREIDLGETTIASAAIRAHKGGDA